MPLFQPKDSEYNPKPRHSCPSDPKALFKGTKERDFDNNSITKVSTFSISSNTSSTLSLKLIGKLHGQTNIQNFTNMPNLYNMNSVPQKVNAPHTKFNRSLIETNG